MDYVQLAAKQALEIENLKERADFMAKTVNKILSSFVCIGGPLNDNKLKFDKQQLSFLARIYNELYYEADHEER